MSLYLWITLGSAPDGFARFVRSGFVAHHLGGTFPGGTRPGLTGVVLVTHEKVRPLHARHSHRPFPVEGA